MSDTRRPTCPTCDGATQTRNAIGILTHCPDCVDGAVSLEQLVATYNAVWNDAQWPDAHLPAYMVLDILRSVKPC